MSKNANVANGPDGHADAEALVDAVAARLGCAAGRRARRLDRRDRPALPDGPRARRRRRHAPASRPAATSRAAARGIMTTDTVEKVAAATVGAGPARVVGIRQGRRHDRARHGDDDRRAADRRRGRPADLDAVFRRVVDDTFNCVSVDTDTSTSDTAVVLASGAAGAGRPGRARGRAAVGGRLADPPDRPRRRGRRDARSRSHVDAARDRAQAKRVAKAIVNSPLVKTAVHGADPNWGRVGDGHRQVLRRHRHRPGAGRRSASATARCTRRAVDDAELATLSGLPARRRGPRSTSRWRTDGPTRRVHRVGLRPRPTATSASTPTTRRGHRAFADRCASHGSGHFGGMRMPPSTRIVSAFM